MRIFYGTVGLGGHLTPFMAVARQLVARGHEVTPFAHHDIQSQLVAAGVACEPARHMSAEPSPLDRMSISESARRLRDEAWARRWYTLLHLARTDAEVEHVRGILRELRPDVVCTEPSLYGVSIAADLEQIPWAAIPASLETAIPRTWSCFPHDWARAAEPSRARLFARHRVAGEFRGWHRISPWLNTLFATEAFVPREFCDNHVSVFVGPHCSAAPPTQDRFPWEALDSRRPLVYVATGSGTGFEPSVVRALLEGIPAEAQVVFSAADPEHRAAFAARGIAVAYAPQLALLQRCDVMITHGGSTSVTECLHAGKPMLIIPITHEQPALGRVVEQRGLGRAIAPERITADHVRASLGELLDPGGSARTNARAVGQSYRQRDGASRAAQLIETLGRDRQPIGIDAAVAGEGP